jgi:hypothetical protein
MPIETNGHLSWCEEYEEIAPGHYVTKRSSYEWHGGPVIDVDDWDVLEWVSRDERENLRPGSVLRIGPYRVRLVERSFAIGGWRAVRVDGPWSWLYVVWAHIDRLWSPIKRVFWRTMWAWGLVVAECGGRPEWRWKKRDANE